METIGADSLRSFLSSGWSGGPVNNYQIRTDRGFDVATFKDLVGHVAQLAFYNPNFVLLYRGQNRNWHNRSEGGTQTVLKPTIFRARRKETPLSVAIPQRYSRLQRAEDLLVEKWLEAKLEGSERIERHRILRWAILQHYEVCDTPLLDVTQSLRVAASFASLGATNDLAYLYVLAVPQLTGAITASAEAGLQIVRLNGICPPSAARAHFQEGYLIGEYPEIQTPKERQKYEPFELDAGRRLVAKFRLRMDGFWNDPAFPKLSRNALFPKEEDKEKGLEAVIRKIRVELGPFQFRIFSAA